MYLDPIDAAAVNETANARSSDVAVAASQAPVPKKAAALIDAYREHGHLMATLDPLGLSTAGHAPALSPLYHGLHRSQPITIEDAPFASAATVGELEEQLKRAYCGALALDCSGVRNELRCAWLFQRLERDLALPAPTPQQREALLARLLDAEMWERLVAARHEDAKRFSLEGCESFVPLLDTLIARAASDGTQQLFLAMPHRGRVNTLVNVMDFSVQRMLDRLDPESDLAAGQTDLPYHLGGDVTKRTPHGDVAVVLAHNPSHLQSVYPVVSGMARAWKDDHPGKDCVTVVVHGDAAFAGQGVVMETLNMTGKDGYGVGGTIHVILNNQIGFTTLNRMNVSDHAYCTDIARMIDAPVVRVNADHPEEVLRAARLAYDYRKQHGSDIVIDLIGYRRLGHSEHDAPAVTQPLLQTAIDMHPTVTELYYIATGGGTALPGLRDDALRRLASKPAVADAMRADSNKTDAPTVRPGTQVSLSQLRALTAAITLVPENVSLHPIVASMLEKWQDTVVSEDCAADWRFAENMAYASLLEAGHDIRLSGLDVGRGTFMHRHAVWHARDAHNLPGRSYVPLNAIAAKQGRFDIVNSPLTEEAVLGFEYGYSVQTAATMAVWEAQYGDFVNGAQVFIDQYIAAGEYKWGYQSALAVLLPHGHEGVGPEHSSGYLGRFLQLCADENVRIVVPSTSAQWFHLLRQQAMGERRTPLIVMSPKSKLYANVASHAPLREMVDGSFENVLDDERIADATTVERVVLCSGKFFYELRDARDASRDQSTAIIRVEQLYPFPHDQLRRVLARFTNLRSVVWAQEEDRNQGAWRFVRDELETVLPASCALRDVCRKVTPAGAHSTVAAHRREQQRLVAAALTSDTL
ncbi:2-oxoglutarate dehydrogenase E1 component [Caballeronia grimmiae]|uniref:oxoglutarate dehydrogenase (succinyl-transferring) n=1 Tax=Caballeronia grimmiae TaxID=1071679 RepID=A0A069NFD2_9BURK|nr:2-oxoglutarate dehydrogenase E1 component [Caballeronia grimmiae]KDR27040.1 2-oxoglutarate dehydrogenase [Caballeronia grimmiae]GGD89527.1 2-oxoglutarate dehydrogenase subunit E1 [Caballeronia grimmiae]